MEKKLGKRQYNTIHQWVKRHYVKSGSCQMCNTNKARTHWANVSGEYKRHERDDWIELCPRCHYKYDTHLHTVTSRGKPKILGTIYKMNELRPELKNSGIKIDGLASAELRIKTYAWYNPQQQG